MQPSVHGLSVHADSMWRGRPRPRSAGTTDHSYPSGMREK